MFGAGPVGLLCAYSATIRGASKVYSIDYVQSRLDKAASIGAIPINLTHGDPVVQITAREPAGVRRSCDRVGFDSLNDKLERQPGIVLDNCIRVTEATGGIGLIGEFPPPAEGPTAGAPLSTGKEGLFPVSIGLLWVKGLSLNGGIAEIHRLQPLLRDLIESGKARPSFIIDEILYSLDVVPHAYKRFERREIGKPVIRLSRLDGDQIDNDGVAGDRILGKL